MKNLQSEPRVTLVVVPRERFSCTQESLESIYEHTTIPFNLIYVDGNSPNKVHQYLQQQAQAKNFQLLRTDYYLTPNQARNLGLSHVKTPYLVFMDNDVIVTKGWLKSLVACAEESEAAVVGPLMCQEKPLHEIVHFAGGESHIWVDQLGRRRLKEKMYKQGKKVQEIYREISRAETELAEFHCVLVRRSIFEKVGYLDEAIMNTKEHLDFCMIVRNAGEKVYFEPASIVTYVPGPPLEWTDLHFYMLRWSNAWQLASLKRIQDKWNLAEDGYFQNKYKKMGWRRYGTIIYPLAHRLTFGFGSGLLARAIAKMEHIFNRYLTNRHLQQQQQIKATQPQTSPQN